MALENNRVAVTFTDLKGYPDASPFHPPQKYPEFSSNDRHPDNHIYAYIRDTLHHLGLDQENFNTPNWNPFKDLVKPGDTVFIKPNMVQQRHEHNKDVLSVIVHASIIRPVLDYLCKALQDRGRIIIADCPLIFSSFDEAIAVSRLGELLQWYRNQTPIPIECFDLRTVRGTRTWLYGKWARKKVHADPRGYQLVDLAQHSYFKDIDPKKLRIGIAGYKDIYKHHSDGRHEYLFPKSLLHSDVIINLPKMKTHRRTAITLALKNFMGLPSAKGCLPHFTIGAPQEGGDQYIHPSWRKRIGTTLHDTIQTHPLIPVKFVCAVIKKLLWNSHWIIPFKDDIFEAMWHGNDTVWRTLLDLNRAAFYADKDGKLHDTPQRGYFCLMDGIIAGEKDGPVAPDPVPAGVLMAGFNPAAIDSVAASLMGFDIDKIPLIKKALQDTNRSSPLYFGRRDDIEVIDGTEAMTLAEFQQRRNLKFEPHPNWKGHVERE